MNIPKELLYTSTDEWVRKEDDGTIVVGITDHAQEQLGEIVYVDLPELDAEVDAGDEVCVVESVKTAGDIYSPIAGKIIDVNSELADMPTCLNNDPYGDGWLFKLQPTNEDDYDNLLDADAYQEHIDERE